MSKANSKLYSFDGTTELNTQLARPDKYKTLLQELSENRYIARGSGLSYALASAGKDSLSISTVLFNRIIAFDKDARTVTAEPGLTIGELLDFAVMHQLYFPVLPGYPKITIGGCAGFNVHGKTQFSIGNFSDFVISFRLFTPLLGEVNCSRTENTELFDLTLGGLGLTGFITQLTLQLVPLKGNAIKSTKLPVKNLLHAVEVMRESKNDDTILYSWNNFNLSGSSFGKGFVFSEQFVDEDVSVSQRPYGSMDANNRRGANPLANGLSFRAVPITYNLMESIKGKSQLLDLRTASFPIDGKEIYFKFFGNKGFREYQAIIPFEDFDSFNSDFEQVIRKSNVPVTLGSLKLFNGSTTYLNFCTTGVCVTIDVPSSAKSLSLFEQIDKLLIKYNGIANLSKDSRLSSEVVKQMYPEYELFKANIQKIDPEKKISSILRERIDV